MAAIFVKERREDGSAASSGASSITSNWRSSSSLKQSDSSLGAPDTSAPSAGDARMRRACATAVVGTRRMLRTLAKSQSIDDRQSAPDFRVIGLPGSLLRREH